MPTVDLSFTITAIIAICALLSPVLTTILNNHHQKAMKRLEYKEEEKQRQSEKTQKIYEEYLLAAGACVQSPTGEALRAFGRRSALLICYVTNQELQVMIMDLERCLYANNDHRKAQDLLDEIAVRLRPLLLQP